MKTTPSSEIAAGGWKAEVVGLETGWVGNYHLLEDVKICVCATDEQSALRYIRSSVARCRRVLFNMKVFGGSFRDLRYRHVVLGNQGFIVLAENSCSVAPLNRPAVCDELSPYVPTTPMRFRHERASACDTLDRTKTRCSSLFPTTRLSLRLGRLRSATTH